MVKEEDYVTEDVARTLKEKGFNQKCKGYFYRSLFSLSCFFNEYNKIKTADQLISAPSLAQAAKWLREREQIYIRVDFLSDLSEGRYTPTITWRFKIFKLEEPDFLEDGDGFYSYEEALNEGLKEALKMI